MAERVVLHVGLMKSGTSTLQVRLMSAPEGLAAHGFLFPGGRWRYQLFAVQDVLAWKQRAEGEYDGAWARLVREIDEYDGTAVVSMEFLAAPGEEKLRRVAESFPDTRVEVVVTARDLGRCLPSMWQESLKNGHSTRWEDYVRAVRDRTGPGEAFWREQDAAEVVRKWSAVLGADHVTLVTLPREGGDPEELWRRFCTATGLAQEACPPRPPGNESLGVASAEVLRRVNEILEQRGVPWPAYSDVVKFGFAKSLLGARRREEEPIGFKPPRWVRAEGSRMQQALAASGVRVVGDLDDLTPIPARGRRPSRLRTRQEAEAAVHAVAALLGRDIDRFVADRRE